MTSPLGLRGLKFDGPFGPEGFGIAHGGHWVARVQRVQKVLPAFGRRVQRVWWRLAPQI